MDSSLDKRPLVYLATGTMQKGSLLIFTEEPTANIISALQWQGFEPASIDSPVVQRILRSHLPPDTKEPSRSPAQPTARRTTKNKKAA